MQEDEKEESFGQRVHIWTEEEISNLPNYSIWFYGLVLDEKTGDIILSEISPGLGFSNFSIREDDGDHKPIDPKDQFADIGSDIMIRTPDQLAEEYPKAEKVDWESEIEEAIRNPSVPFDFSDDRTLFLKLMDARYVLDWFMDNKNTCYHPSEIETCAEDPDLLEQITQLEKLGIIEQTTQGCYQLNKKNEIARTLVHLDDLVCEDAANNACSE